MSGYEDQADDYGYDLAHEVKTYLAPPANPHPTTPTSSGPHRPLDPDSDFGYDEAHEF